MTFPITPVVSRWLLLTLSVLFILGGCSSTDKPASTEGMSQLEIRQLQSRSYSGTGEKTVMKAVIAALQDEGFIISTANQELGLITASMEVNDEDKGSKQWVELWYGKGMGNYQTTRRYDASATVQAKDEDIRVRINITAKAMTNSGGIIWSQTVADPAFYQAIFSKIDKSLFLEKEKI